MKLRLILLFNEKLDLIDTILPKFMSKKDFWLKLIKLTKL